MQRRSGVCSGNQSSHRLSVCVVSPCNDEHWPVAQGLFDRCHSISTSPSRFVVEFIISSFVMYNHPPLHAQAPQCPFHLPTDDTFSRSLQTGFLFRVLVSYHPLESWTGATDYFDCPAFTEWHQFSCLPTKRIKFMSCSYLFPATVCLIPSHRSLYLANSHSSFHHQSPSVA
jgi:hypothetical protein